jgi:hypothetical protein
MKSAFCIAFLLSLSVCTAHAMQEQPIIMEALTPPPDLMPPEAKELIEILNNPDKHEQPDHISIIGNSGSGKTTICEQIIAEIGATPMFCDGYDLVNGYAECSDKSEIEITVLQSLVMPTIQAAQQQQKSRAVLVISNFQALYNKQSREPIRHLLTALNPANYADLKPALLIINESLPLNNNPQFELPPAEGKNIIHITPPNLAQREQFIRYLVEQYNYPCDNAVQQQLAQTTEGKSLMTIAFFLSRTCPKDMPEDDLGLINEYSLPASRQSSPPGPLSRAQFQEPGESTRIVPPPTTSPEPDESCCNCSTIFSLTGD